MAKKTKRKKLFNLFGRKEKNRHRDIIEQERDNSLEDSAEYSRFKQRLKKEIVRARKIAADDPLYLTQLYTLIDNATLAEKAKIMEAYHKRTTERQNNDMAYRAKLRELKNRYSAIATELELRYEKLNRFNTVVVSRKSEEYVTVISDDANKK